MPFVLQTPHDWPLGETMDELQIQEVATEVLLKCLGSLEIGHEPIALPALPNRVYTAVIGIAGAHASATVMVVAGQSFWAAVYAAGFNDSSFAIDPTDEELCDAAGEFVNVMCGKLRRELASQGVDTRLATPLCMMGVLVRCPEPVGKLSKWTSLSTPHGVIRMRCDVGFIEKVDAGNVASPDVAEEGQFLVL